ncbi:unnamed protein product [Amoebophrya sp. A120]|nr:unnamed protein product [Amoebophrya sp. A120]|eukprot:GSA120T00013430001.1
MSSTTATRPPASGNKDDDQPDEPVGNPLVRYSSVYAALFLLGGAIGYTVQNSYISLLAGALTAGLIEGTSYFFFRTAVVNTNNMRNGSALLAALSVILAGFFLKRYWKNPKKIVPAIPMTFICGFSCLVYLYFVYLSSEAFVTGVSRFEGKKGSDDEEPPHEGKKKK